MKTILAVSAVLLAGCNPIVQHVQTEPVAPEWHQGIQVVSIAAIPQTEADLLRGIALESLREIEPLAVEMTIAPVGGIWALPTASFGVPTPVGPPARGISSESPPWTASFCVAYTIRDASGKALERKTADCLLGDSDHTEKYRSIVKEIAERIKELQMKS